MGDSWEDFDDDAVPVVPQVALPPVKSSWEDEDLPEDPNAGKTPKEIAAEAEKRRKAEESRRQKAASDTERALWKQQAEEEALRIANETPEERALRERRAIEQADNNLADELFGGSRVGRSTSSSSSKSPSPNLAKTGGGGGGLSLTFNNAGDFAVVAKDLGQKFKKATAKDVSNFFSDLLAKGAKEPLGVDEVNDLIKKLQALAVEKQRIADANRNKMDAKQKALSAKKKDHEEKSKKHEELFGGGYDDDDAGMDQYYSMEDDFM